MRLNRDGKIDHIICLDKNGLYKYAGGLIHRISEVWNPCILSLFNGPTDISFPFLKQMFYIVSMSGRSAIATLLLFYYLNYLCILIYIVIQNAFEGF